MKLEVVTPIAQVLTCEAAGITVPALQGDLGALPGHLPLLTTLRPGVLVADVSGSPQLVAISTGVAEVLPDRVTVLADAAILASDIDLEAARRDLEVATKALEAALAKESDFVGAGKEGSEARDHLTRAAGAEALAGATGSGHGAYSFTLLTLIGDDVGDIAEHLIENAGDLAADAVEVIEGVTDGFAGKSSRASGDGSLDGIDHAFDPHATLRAAVGYAQAQIDAASTRH